MTTWRATAMIILNVMAWLFALAIPKVSIASYRLQVLTGRRRILHKQESAKPLFARTLTFLLEWPAHRLRASTPKERRQRLALSLNQAGLEMDPAIYMTLRILAALVGGILGLATAALEIPFGAIVGLTLILGAVGAMGPAVWLARRHRFRKLRLRQEIPDAVELIAMCLEAGMTFDAAVKEYAQVERGSLGQLLGKYLEDRSWGQTREEAFRLLAERGGSDELTQMAMAVENGVTLGVPLAKVLREQAAFFRTMNLRRAEEQAHQLPVKLLFPLVLFMFPALFIVILGPIVVQILRGGLGR